MPEFGDGLAGSYDKLASLLREIGELEKAGEAHRKAINIWRILVRDDPNVSHRNGLAGGYHNLGIVLEITGESAKAVASFKKAHEIFETLVQDHPRVASYRADLDLLIVAGAKSSTNIGRSKTMPEYQDILASASQLPIEDRLRLIDDFASSVPDDQPPKLSDEWLAEIKRRSEEIKSGAVQTES